MRTAKTMLWSVTGRDFCGFVVKAATFEKAEKKARKYRGFSIAERPVLCIKQF